jgi:carbonic anhydrase
MAACSKVIVLVCMDARLDPAKILGLSEGDAHVIRNAGGRAVDALRSVVISQQLLGTQEIVIVHHVSEPSHRLFFHTR